MGVAITKFLDFFFTSVLLFLSIVIGLFCKGVLQPLCTRAPACCWTAKRPDSLLPQMGICSNGWLACAKDFYLINFKKRKRIDIKMFIQLQSVSFLSFPSQTSQRPLLLHLTIIPPFLLLPSQYSPHC